MVRDEKVERAAKNLIEAMKDSDCYKKFHEKKRIAASDETLKSQILRTRMIREQISKMSDYEKESQLADNLIEEYDNLMDITEVHEFSIAELEFCNLFRDVTAELVNSFEIELKAGEF